MTVFSIAISIVFANLILLQCMYMHRKFMMHRSEKQLAAMGIVPRGAQLLHGMVLTEDGKGVRSVSAPNSSWYSRLL